MDFSTKGSMYETIADKIEHLILTEKMHTDSKLPSEQYLADSFGVSRPVIREALKLLRERGLITSRQGAASVITEPCSDILEKNLGRIILMKNVSPLQVYEIRSVLEELSVRKAAECFTEKDIEELYAANDVVKASIGKMPLRAETDIAFHKRIAEISANPLLMMMLEAVSSLMLPIIISNLERIGSSDDAFYSHDRIIKAISSGDPERAAEEMRLHLTDSSKWYSGFEGDVFKVPSSIE